MTQSPPVGGFIERERLDPPGRVGIVGMGHFGQFSAESYRRAGDLEVVSVADSHADEHAARLRALEVGSAFKTKDELFDDEHVETIHIATPPVNHHELGLRAARAGKSVLMEKPLALTIAEADELIDAFARAGLTLSVNYVMRHIPIYRLIIDLSRSGVLGELRRISLDNAAEPVLDDHWFWDRSISGGILVEHGVHFFDVMAQIAGTATPVFTIDDGRRVSTSLTYDSGTWATFYHDFGLAYDDVDRFDVSLDFENGYAHITGWIPETLDMRAVTPGQLPAWQEILARYPGMQAEYAGETVSVTARVPSRTDAYRAAVAEGMREVVVAHRNPDVPPSVKPADGRASLEVALAAQALADKPTSS